MTGLPKLGPVQIPPVLNIKDLDLVTFLVNSIANPVLAASSGSMALKWCAKRSPDQMRVGYEWPGDKLPGSENDRGGKSLDKGSAGTQSEDQSVRLLG